MPHTVAAAALSHPSCTDSTSPATLLANPLNASTFYACIANRASALLLQCPACPPVLQPLVCKSSSLMTYDAKLQRCNW
jgi:hypothetical protein